VKLIVGLGNPGEQYSFTRHNLGFMTIDCLAEKYGITLRKEGFMALYGKGEIEEDAVLLAKPQTFMNLSGRAVKKMLDYFRINLEDLIVIHDDLDLPFGVIRLKRGGGEAGHKGLISNVDELNERDFLRVRLGIGKPTNKNLIERYVLSPFSEEERKALPSFLTTAAEAVRDLLIFGLNAAMQKYHKNKLSPAPSGEKVS